MSLQSSTPPTIFTESLMRSATAGVTCVLIDRFILKQTDLKKSLVFGATVAGATAAASVISKTVTIPDFTSTTFANEKKVGERLVEIGTATAGAYAVNKYVMKNGNSSIGKTAVAIVLSNVVSEYTIDFMASRNLSIFQ
jgi:hypothetical protein